MYAQPADSFLAALSVIFCVCAVSVIEMLVNCLAGLPVTHSLPIWRTRTENRSLQVYSVPGIDPLNMLVSCVFTLKLWTACQPVEVVTCSASNLLQSRTRHGTTTQCGYDADSSAMHHQLSYIPCVFKWFDLLVLQVMILNACCKNRLRIKNSLMCHHSKGLEVKGK